MRGEREPVAFDWESGQRERFDERLREVDSQIAAGAHALDLLTQHAEQCAAGLRARDAANSDLWDNETPADVLL